MAPARGGKGKIGGTKENGPARIGGTKEIGGLKEMGPARIGVE